MALTYSLKFKKLNSYQKVILEKEGEVVIDRNSFKLKGKGAQDQGENIYFGDIKDLMIRDDYLAITTYSRDKYVLINFVNLFDSFLKDFFRVRNEYLADNLFMKVGMMVKEYEGNIEIINPYGKSINKGKSRIQFYEGSIVFIPEIKECFAVYLNFLKNHEFDEDEYVVKFFMENGSTVVISKLGTTYDDVRTTIESIMGKMYERILNFLNEVLMEFDANTLLKLAYKIKEGRCVQFSSLKKIHEDLPAKLEELAFKDNDLLREKVSLLRKNTEDTNFYLGFSLSKTDDGEVTAKSWYVCAIPEKNIIALGTGSDQNVYFFRIIMQQGIPADKLKAKLLEIDKNMVLFHQDMNPVCKDRRELRKTKYRAPIKKMSFLRLLRKSFLGKSHATDVKSFKKDVEAAFKKAELKIPQHLGADAK